MEGSPVRGQHRSRIVQLNQARDLQSFQAEFTRVLSAEVQHADVFFGKQLPAWVKSHLDTHPALTKKLEEGELVGISYTETQKPRPATAARSNVVLIPVINDGVLHGVAGVVSSSDGPHVSPEDIETVRQCAHEAGPIIARLIDIENLRLKNRQLAEDKKTAEAVIQMRSHLQSNVAHELRTPLAAIRGYARMILDGRGGDLNGIQRDYLGIVNENTNRLINLVSWMSHVANLSAQHFDLATFDLREVWDDCMKTNQEVVDSKSIRLVQNIPADSFGLIGDRAKLAYVFNQLISAAVMFCARQGQINIEFSHGREHEVAVKINAAGSGIPSEILSRIFDRSAIANAVPPLQSSGPETLNLSGVYDVVGMHGGRIFVNSSAGKGSTFLFTLPAVKFDGEEKLA